MWDFTPKLCFLLLICLSEACISRIKDGIDAFTNADNISFTLTPSNTTPTTLINRFNRFNRINRFNHSTSTTPTTNDSDSVDNGGKWRTTCEKPCRGDTCRRAEEKVKNLLDMTVDPCEDFFRFACKESGRGKSPLPKKPETVSFLELVQNPPSEEFQFIKDFYDSCVAITGQFATVDVVEYCLADGKCDEDEVAKFGWNYVDFLRYIKQFAEETKWPAVTEGNWDKITENWYKVGWTWWDFSARVMARSHFLGAFQYIDGTVTEGRDVFHSNVFFAPMIEKTIDYDRFEDGDLSSRIHIVPMTVDQGLFENPEKIVQYRKLLRLVIGYLGRNSDTLDKEVDTIIEHQKQLANISAIEYYSDDSWSEVSILKLSEMVPHVNWLDYINSALNSSDVTLKGSDTVLIPPEELLVKVGNWVDTLSRRDQANLITWTIFADFSNNFMHTGEEKITEVRKNVFEYIHEERLRDNCPWCDTPLLDILPEYATEDNRRSSNCLIQIQKLFPSVGRDMFIQKYLNQQEIDEIKSLFSNLTIEFREIIKENTWMDNRTKKGALRKLDDVQIFVGETTKKTQNLDQLKEMISSKDYIGNILAIGNYHWTKRVRSLKTNKDILSGNERENNAFYWPLLNSVVIKAGLINGILDLGFSLKYPSSLLFGGFVASTLGHELLHGFDSRGKNYGPGGLRFDWWEADANKAFETKASQCENQYSEFPIVYKGETYNTEGIGYPPGENIADNGGVKVALRTYNKARGGEDDTCFPSLPLSQKQLFWTGYAMDWCVLGGQYENYKNIEDLLTSGVSYAGHVPAPWRVNVVFSNIPEFAEDFNCPTKEKNLFPEEKCEIW